LSPQVRRMTADELERWHLEHLVKQLTEGLRTHRSLTYSTDYVEDVELWRRAARVAGRRLGIPVRTGVSRDGTKVWLPKDRDRLSSNS
jgi:hypothetical protein